MPGKPPTLEPTLSSIKEPGARVCPHECEEVRCVRPVMFAKAGNACRRHAENHKLHPRCNRHCPTYFHLRDPVFEREATYDEWMSFPQSIREFFRLKHLARVPERDLDSEEEEQEDSDEEEEEESGSEPGSKQESGSEKESGSGQESGSEQEEEQGSDQSSGQEESQQECQQVLEQESELESEQTSEQGSELEACSEPEQQVEVELEYDDVSLVHIQLYHSNSDVFNRKDGRRRLSGRPKLEPGSTVGLVHGGESG